MIFDLCVKCVLQKLHCLVKQFTVSLFRHFAKRFVSLVLQKTGMRNKLNVFGTVESTTASLFCYYFAKGSKFRCFAKRFVICFRETDVKQAKNFVK